MSKVYLLIFLIAAGHAAGLSQTKTDLEIRELKGNVRQVNYYDVYRWSDSDKTGAAERKLTNIAIFNRKGNLRIQIEFSGNGKDCSYKKTLYYYDRKSRKRQSMVYQSAKNEELCTQKDISFPRNRLSEIGEKPLSLIERTNYKYDRRHRILSEITKDRKNSLLQKNEYEYNRRGENTRFKITQRQNRVSGSSGQFVKTIDFRTTYHHRGKTTYRYEDGQSIYRIDYHTDGRGRFRREEQYKIQSDSQNRITGKILTSRSKTYYEGNREILDWTIFDNQGRDSTQLYILSEKDNERLRLEYTPKLENNLAEMNPVRTERVTHYRFAPDAGREVNQQLKYLLRYDRSVDRAEWQAARFETRDYKYDRRGNIIRSTIWQQDSPSQVGKSESTSEMEIFYFK